jgi:hypothetical protein
MSETILLGGEPRKADATQPVREGASEPAQQPGGEVPSAGESALTLGNLIDERREAQLQPWQRQQLQEYSPDFYKRLMQDTCAVAAALDASDPVLLGVRHHVRERFPGVDDLAVLHRVREWLGAEYGLKAEQAEVLPLAELLEKLREGRPAGNDAGQTPVGEAFTPPDSTASCIKSDPKEYLWNWREILFALELKNTPDRRWQIRKLNDAYCGPIIFPGAGGQPKVVKAKLLSWWNSLEQEWEASEQTRTNAQATAQEQYSHGRDGIVTPKLTGHVKKRRKKRIDRQSPPDET